MTDQEQEKASDLLRKALQPLEEEHWNTIYITIERRLIEMLIQNFELKK